MIKKNARKLALAKTTLVSLTHTQLDHVHGGRSVSCPTATSCSVPWTACF